ncbi:MAG: hypothetical protein OK404_00460 [Thaumarchaeota archaeon]|nr:hypothetical protein [Nitrososphaerota archaeon]
MLLVAEAEETYCLKTQTHVPVSNGANKVCYRCGMLLGPSEEPGLGSLLDY